MSDIFLENICLFWYLGTIDICDGRRQGVTPSLVVIDKLNQHPTLKKYFLDCGKQLVRTHTNRKTTGPKSNPRFSCCEVAALLLKYLHSSYTQISADSLVNMAFNKRQYSLNETGWTQNDVLYSVLSNILIVFSFAFALLFWVRHYMSKMFWNSLPPHLRNINSLPLFKSS